MATGEVDRQVGMGLLRRDQLLRLAVRVAGRIREQGRVTLGSQEVICDTVGFVRGAVKCCGLNEVQIASVTNQPFFVLTVRTTNEHIALSHQCSISSLKVPPFVQFATAPLCDTWYNNSMLFIWFSSTWYILSTTAEHSLLDVHTLVSGPRNYLCCALHFRPTPSPRRTTAVI